MKIFMVRHFATPGNLKKRYIGKTDEPILCPETVKPMPIVQRLYVSPMKRCRETAFLLYPEAEQRIVEAFRECDFGEFENKNYQELAGNSNYQKWIDSGGNGAFPGGEHPMDFRQRSKKAFEKCVEELISWKVDTAAMVVHGGTIMAVLEAYASPRKEFYEWHTDNGSGFCLEIEPDAWKSGEKVLYPEYRIERKDR